MFFLLTDSLGALQERASTEQRPCVWHALWVRRPLFNASSTFAAASTHHLSLMDAAMRSGFYRKSRRKMQHTLTSYSILLIFSPSAALSLWSVWHLQYGGFTDLNRIRIHVVRWSIALCRYCCTNVNRWFANKFFKSNLIQNHCLKLLLQMFFPTRTD